MLIVEFEILLIQCGCSLYINFSEKEQKEWKKDNSIHITALPYASCLTLLQLLITNSKSLPIKCRKHEEFNVSVVDFLDK